MVAVGGDPKAGRRGHQAQTGQVLAFLAFALAICSPAIAETRLDDLEIVHWRINALKLIDCKANAFEAQRRLERLGIASRFVVVKTETGGWHAIIVVDGKWALDNRQKHVVTVDQLRAVGYTIAPLG
jgi:hypothetical protein